MAKMLQVRNVPDAVHRVLRVRAAQAGMSLSEFVCRELSVLTSRPTLDELIERIHQRGSAAHELDTVKAVRAERDSRR